jgi:hypothetical protein
VSGSIQTGVFGRVYKAVQIYSSIFYLQHKTKKKTKTLSCTLPLPRMPLWPSSPWSRTPKDLRCTRNPSLRVWILTLQWPTSLNPVVLYQPPLLATSTFQTSGKPLALLDAGITVGKPGIVGAEVKVISIVVGVSADHGLGERAIAAIAVQIVVNAVKCKTPCLYEFNIRVRLSICVFVFLLFDSRTTQPCTFISTAIIM